MKIKIKSASSAGLGDAPDMSKKGKMSVSQAFGEMKTNPPAILAKTKAKKGTAQANKQRVAIAMSKAGKSIK